MIRVKRVYEPHGHPDGPGYLVERLWPRGVRKESLPLDGWLRDIAPTNELRRWFGHDPARWEEFQRRYRAELDAHPETWQPLLEAARRGDVTLYYSARDTEHNNALALKEYLEGKLPRH
ncbi:MAG: putative uroporphyrin-III c-methyltransferase [Rhodocyclaceae bacterium]|nr:putative uroporphyrin-III c-methyltransferase [Rhodocyclaceae bacterium]